MPFFTSQFFSISGRWWVANRYTMLCKPLGWRATPLTRWTISSRGMSFWFGHLGGPNFVKGESLSKSPTWPTVQLGGWSLWLLFGAGLLKNMMLYDSVSSKIQIHMHKNLVDLVFFFSKHEFTTSTTMVSLLRPQNSRCETALVWPLEPHGQVNLLSDFIGLSFKARNLGRCVVHLVLAKNAQCFKGYTDGSEKTNGKLYFPQNNVKCLDFFGEWFRTPCQRLLVTSNWIKSYF